ncbi:hypothetical protein [Erwinia persicina]|uniref:hypothetical protein n=1 Tax=Erwinia persicina TaxID=55211 RepID=UPI000B034A76|nr:hypothetical protein [Erwinia persicina]
MQASDFTNTLIQRHFVQLRESHNLIYQFAIEAEGKDKSFIVNPQVKQTMGWPAHVISMYDYRKMWGVDYDRLMHLCIISFCTEMEFMFKAIFTQYGYSTIGNAKGFYQRFSDVVTALTLVGINFSSIQPSLDRLNTAFQIRHMCIHNLGIVDQGFHNNTGLGMVGQAYTITQSDYIGMVDACVELQKLLDAQLP